MGRSSGGADLETFVATLLSEFDRLMARVQVATERSLILQQQSRGLCARRRWSRRPQIRGGSGPEPPRTERTLDKARRGELPAGLRGKMWIGPGSAKRCNGCGESVARGEQEFELEVADALTFRFHAECYHAWATFSGATATTRNAPQS